MEVKITGRIVGASTDFRTGKPCLTLEINERSEFEVLVDEMREKDKLSIEVKPFRQRRSLDANAYAWVLMDRLATALQKSKAEIYCEYVRDIGGNSETVCVRDEAAEKLCEGWRHNGLGWVTETFQSKLPGCTNVILYYGSSTYDTAQMSRLIDLIIQDCKENGIPTETPNQIAEMKARWGE